MIHLHGTLRDVWPFTKPAACMMTLISQKERGTIFWAVPISAFPRALPAILQQHRPEPHEPTFQSQRVGLTFLAPQPEKPLGQFSLRACVLRCPDLARESSAAFISFLLGGFAFAGLVVQGGGVQRSKSRTVAMEPSSKAGYPGSETFKAQGTAVWTHLQQRMGFRRQVIKGQTSRKTSCSRAMEPGNGIRHVVHLQMTPANSTNLSADTRIASFNSRIGELEAHQTNRTTIP